MRMLLPATAGLLALVSLPHAPARAAEPPLRIGAAALNDAWDTDAPGVRRMLKPTDLPPPYETKSAGNGSKTVARPEGAWPKVPAGFHVNIYASGLQQPRKIITAPNGDLFIAESSGNRVRVLRGITADGQPEKSEIFATGLDQPFGLAFYPPGPNPKFLYVANTGSVVRFAYHDGDLQAKASAEKLAPEISAGGHLTGGGHWTRDIVFNREGTKLFLSIGSLSNVGDEEIEQQRARIFEYNADGTGSVPFATGIRNPVGLAIDPKTGTLWSSVNERDGLGDNLVPDYITRVQRGQFYGWPWYYIGDHEEPRLAGKHPELRGKVATPEVLLQSHSASLCLTFATGPQFPEAYRGGIFAAEHGSWNRERRLGSKLIYVPVDAQGAPRGEYQDFMTGFVIDEKTVWGRLVGVTVAKDGSLYVTDDGSGSVWHVWYDGKTDKK